MSRLSKNWTIDMQRESAKKSQKEYYKNNKEDCKERTKKWRDNHKEQELKRVALWWKNHPDKLREKQQRRTKKLKLLVITHYSNGSMKCCCPKCNEDNMGFLSIDHINNNGTEERKKYGNGSRFYHWLIKNGYPEGYKVMCYNCNLGRAKNNDICPHQNEIEVNTIEVQALYQQNHP